MNKKIDNRTYAEVSSTLVVSAEAYLEDCAEHGSLPSEEGFKSYAVEITEDVPWHKAEDSVQVVYPTTLERRRYLDLVAVFSWLAEPSVGCADCENIGFNCAMNRTEEVQWSYTAIARELRYRAAEQTDLRDWINANQEEADNIAQSYFFVYDDDEGVWRVDEEERL